MKKIIEVIENVINHEVYGRDYPRFTMVHPRKNVDGSIQTKNTASEIHIDHVSIVSAAVYFSDVTCETSRMQVLSGTHRFLIYPLQFSKRCSRHFSIDSNCLIALAVLVPCKSIWVMFCIGLCQSRSRVDYGFSYRFQMDTIFLFDPWSMSVSIPRGDEGVSFAETTGDRFFDGLYPKMPLKGYKLRDRRIHPVKGNNI